MSTQMYVDLMMKDILDSAGKKSEVNVFRFPFIGTLAGGTVLVDSIPEPIPLSKFQYLVDYRTTTKPNYTSGDRLMVVPVGDGGHWIIIGRLI